MTKREDITVEPAKYWPLAHLTNDELLALIIYDESKAQGVAARFEIQALLSGYRIAGGLGAIVDYIHARFGGWSGTLSALNVHLDARDAAWDAADPSRASRRGGTL